MMAKDRPILEELMQYLDSRCKHTADPSRLERLIMKYREGYLDEALLRMERDELATAYDFGSKEEFARNYTEEHVAHPDPLGDKGHYEWGGSCGLAGAPEAECPSKERKLQ